MPTQSPPQPPQPPVSEECDRTLFGRKPHHPGNDDPDLRKPPKED